MSTAVVLRAPRHGAGSTPDQVHTYAAQRAVEVTLAAKASLRIRVTEDRRLLKGERRSDGLAPVDAKRFYRLMQKHSLLLRRHTGRQQARERDGQVATISSNCRWCLDALEFTCCNGEVVRLAFALDCHDREVISWARRDQPVSLTMRSGNRYIISKVVNRIPPLTSAIQAKLLEFKDSQRFQPS